ncbi:uncharacterized protein KGF55_001602 [Candida pseudojiufengensis]|uniref:uncharacterized protein n=1 Tax=Candida pseudojiufengensis TaxID=497109 RepID=UPI0022242E4F|nr:uncharacterized protein KGF55_001602 [Candida pseudojiufengensis]KAI5965381.1 hypothetical protein KGF55_001602 [Candida pseudojiufengensis]
MLFLEKKELIQIVSWIFHTNYNILIERHIHSIVLFDTINNKLPYIKSLAAKEGCHLSSFSFGGRFLFLFDLCPIIPTHRINDLKLGKNLITIEDNFGFSKKLRKYSLSKIKLIDDDTGEKFSDNSQDILPLNFDENRKYPVLFSFTVDSVHNKLQKNGVLVLIH